MKHREGSLRGLQAKHGFGPGCACSGSAESLFSGNPTTNAAVISSKAQPRRLRMLKVKRVFDPESEVNYRASQTCWQAILKLECDTQ